MGTLERIGSARGFIRSRSAERRRTVRAAIDEDARANPELYAKLDPQVSAVLLPLSAVATLTSFIPATHGLPLFVTASTILVSMNMRKLFFLRRLRRGKVRARTGVIDLGELQATPIEGER